MQPWAVLVIYFGSDHTKLLHFPVLMTSTLCPVRPSGGSAAGASGPAWLRDVTAPQKACTVFVCSVPNVSSSRKMDSFGKSLPAFAYTAGEGRAPALYPGARLCLLPRGSRSRQQ